ncbi:MAG TPA: DHH family phosphoesterase [Candidatus Limnocylindria bacterium]|nr:DHH family phosphoesterase [Candidatus Limnocylindria bacterium]
MNAVVDAIRAADRIALVSHRDPDPDTIGSSLALGLALERMGKRVSWHCADPVPEAIRFLASADRYSQAPPPADVDLIVCLDFGEPDRAKFPLPSGPKIADIDHHATNTAFGDANFVDVTSAATGEMVGRVIDALGTGWTPDMATAALVAIMTDTGSFQFPNTDTRALERAAMLRGAGADLQAITYNIFRNKRFEALKLWGFAFSRLVREFDGLLVWTWIENDDLAHAGALEEDLSGLVEQIARSKGMRVALLFSGTTGSLKVSCRTSASAPSVDAAALMAAFGGGGHVRAAGALVPPVAGGDDHAAIRERILTAAREALDRARQPT